MQNEDISPIEFHSVLQETEKYCKIKVSIKNREIANTSSAQGVNAVWTMTNYRAMNNTTGNFVVYDAIKFVLKCSFFEYA